MKIKQRKIQTTQDKLQKVTQQAEASQATKMMDKAMALYDEIYRLKTVWLSS